MQTIKAIISFIAFYFLAIFQVSYLTHFKIVGGLWNPVLIAVVFLNFFEKKEDKSGLIIGALGGFYLDLFSPYFLGFFTLIGLGIAFLIKYIRPFLDIKKFISFVAVLFACLLIFEIILTLISIGSGFHFNVFSIIINLFAGIIIYWILKLFNVFAKKKFR
ncbi:MAG: hypothetical protein NTY11_01240 [Candidatus Parcubacteria bacterium]|nr:hypothetical protein [Candidatus Parcubacteria bacterium]